jgi:hypothetical protein
MSDNVKDVRILQQKLDNLRASDSGARGFRQPYESLPLPTAICAFSSLSHHLAIDLLDVGEQRHRIGNGRKHGA